MRVQYEKLAMNSLQATYTFTPMNIGEYIYLISVVEKKNSNDSLQHVKTYDYKGRYWVVP